MGKKILPNKGVDQHGKIRMRISITIQDTVTSQHFEVCRQSWKDLKDNPLFKWGADTGGYVRIGKGTTTKIPRPYSLALAFPITMQVPSFTACPITFLCCSKFSLGSPACTLEQSPGAKAPSLPLLKPQRHPPKDKWASSTCFPWFDPRWVSKILQPLFPSPPSMGLQRQEVGATVPTTCTIGGSCVESGMAGLQGVWWDQGWGLVGQFYT